MSIQVNALTGAGPSATPVASITFNREDSIAGITPIPVPTATGTNFSWKKSLQFEIVANGGLELTALRVGKVTAETVTGTKLWHNTANASYVQASGSPTATGDNNVTGPTVDGDLYTALPLIADPPAVYEAGPETTEDLIGNMVELVAGVDNTCVTSGTAVASPTVRFTWVES